MVRLHMLETMFMGSELGFVSIRFENALFQYHPLKWPGAIENLVSYLLQRAWKQTYAKLYTIWLSEWTAQYDTEVHT